MALVNGCPAKGQFNLSQVAAFGVAPRICGSWSDGDVPRLLFPQAAQVHPANLKALLAEHLRGFREAFGKSDWTG